MLLLQIKVRKNKEVNNGSICYSVIAIGEFSKIYNFITKMKLDKDDIIIVLGDMGLFWRNDKADAKITIEYYEKNFETKLYFLRGNHENHRLLLDLPIENNMGYISEHIALLLDGECYNFQGKDCLVEGGAHSIDWRRRTKNLTWWEEEEVSASAIHKISGGHYDYILSHAAPREIVREYERILCDPRFDQEEIDHTSEDLLNELIYRTTFNQWLFGHYHVDVQLNDTYTCLYNTFLRID